MDFINGPSQPTDMDIIIAKMSVVELQTFQKNCQSLLELALTPSKKQLLNNVLEKSQQMERTLQEQKEASAVPLPEEDPNEKNPASAIPPPEDDFHELEAKTPPPSPSQSMISSPELMERLAKALVVLSEFPEQHYRFVERRSAPPKMSNPNKSEETENKIKAGKNDINSQVSSPIKVAEENSDNLGKDAGDGDVTFSIVYLGYFCVLLGILAVLGAFLQEDGSLDWRFGIPAFTVALSGVLKFIFSAFTGGAFGLGEAMFFGH